MHKTVRLPLLLLVCTTFFSSIFAVGLYQVLHAAPAQTKQAFPPLAPHAQATAPANEPGQEYIVQPGDSLYNISGQFYAEPNAYQRIIDATNAKAAVDPRFSRIVDPRTIRSGQRLWIPDRPDLPIIAPAAPATAVPPTEVVTNTESDTGSSTESGTENAVVTGTMTSTETGVTFVAPLDGAVVAPTFVVTMTAVGFVVEPAGDINPNAGHFHILVDTDFVPAGETIIFDDQHFHYGQGQITTTLTLAPGAHVLRLQFANGAHIALDGDQYRDTITVTVAANATVAERMNEGPGVFFIDPLDGMTVPPTFAVTMMANDLTVEPAGDINPDAGHFHILVDTDFVPAGDTIIFDDQHIHYGKGQVTTTLTLEPGEHVLRLQFANGAHIALDGDEYRDTITVTVDAAAATMSPREGPGVYFVSPLDGATVTPTFAITMASSDLTIEPAGEINPGAGHFHILVDTDFTPAGDVILTDDQHIHFGKGQVTTTLTLEPGEHVLRLQFANGAHIALDGDQYRDTITVTVVADDATALPTADEINVHFVSPQDGDVLGPRVDVIMAADGLIVEPSGEINPGAGHFHILIDTDFVPAGDTIITDDQHIHFGKGEAVTRLNLEPGEHLLRLQFANGAHIALDGAEYQDEITITVRE